MQPFFAVRDGCTHLVAWVLVAAFSASVAAVSSVSTAVFPVLKKANTGTTFLALGLGFSARGDSVVTVGTLCAILRDWLSQLVLQCGKSRGHAGGGRRS